LADGFLNVEPERNPDLSLINLLALKFLDLSILFRLP